MENYEPKSPAPRLLTPSSGQVPLGAVIDWFYFNYIPMPDGYEVCDGNPVQDKQSPFYGIGIDKPNLIDKFVRGVRPGATGATGGTDTIPEDLSGPGMTLSTGQAQIGGFDPSHAFQTQGDECFNHSHVIDCGNRFLHNHGGDNCPPWYGLLKIIRVR